MTNCPKCNEPEPGWVNINDRLPKDGQKVLYHFEPLGTFIGKYTTGEAGENIFYSNYGFLTDDVKWWLPFPEPPKNGE